MKKYVCTRPFTWMSVLDNGDVTCCCPPWINHYFLGNVLKNSFEEIWNGEKAQAFRKSCLDGSFKFCNLKSCQQFSQKTDCVMPLNSVYEKLDDPVLTDIVEGRLVLSHGPLNINLDYDRSCNLCCPSCRREFIVARSKRKENIFLMQEKIMGTFFNDIRILTLISSGDPLGSSTFRNLLLTLSEKEAPNLHHINLLTNGILLKTFWPKFSKFVREKITCVALSIDAATPKTYELNRYPAKWDQLIKNLEFIRRLKLYGPVIDFNVSFIVQKNNFHEMADFVNLAINYSANYVLFQILEPDFIRDLGYHDYFFEWKEKAIHEKTHPQHEELLKVLQDPIFDEIPKKTLLKIKLGPLYDLKQGKDISQMDLVYEEYLSFVNGKKPWHSKTNYSEPITT